jgi:RNA-binding protein YhbY
LLDRWDTLPRLGELAKDAGFRQLVLKQVDQTLNENDLRKIGVNAEKRCLTNLGALCRELKKRTEAR